MRVGAPSAPISRVARSPARRGCVVARADAPADRELVAAESGDDQVRQALRVVVAERRDAVVAIGRSPLVLGGRLAQDPLRREAQQAVADRSTEQVVRLLEAIEVDDEQRDRRRRRRAGAHPARQPFAQHADVREAGDRVVQREPFDALAKAVPLADVADRDDRGARRRQHPRLDRSDAVAAVLRVRRDLRALRVEAAVERRLPRLAERRGQAVDVGDAPSDQRRGRRRQQLGRPARLDDATGVVAADDRLVERGREPARHGRVGVVRRRVRRTIRLR